MEWALEPADTAAVSRLRHQIMHNLARIASADADLDATEIVVAELLTNALAHTTERAWVSLRWDGMHPLLSVADLGPGFTASAVAGNLGLIDAHRTVIPRLPDDPLAESGRGLFLVAHFALDVGVALVALVMSLAFVWYSRNSGDSWYVVWGPFLMAGGAAALGIPVYLAQRGSMTEPDPVPEYK